MLPECKCNKENPSQNKSPLLWTCLMGWSHNFIFCEFKRLDVHRQRRTVFFQKSTYDETKGVQLPIWDSSWWKIYSEHLRHFRINKQRLACLVTLQGTGDAAQVGAALCLHSQELCGVPMAQRGQPCSFRACWIFSECLLLAPCGSYWHNCLSCLELMPSHRDVFANAYLRIIYHWLSLP